MAILKLTINNLAVDRTTTPFSELTSSIAAGATSATLFNAAGFNDDYFLLLGEPSGEQTEVVAITSISVNTVTIPATVFAHSASTPVYCIAYNQIKIYRRRSGVESNIATIAMQWGTNKATTEFYGDATTGDEFATSFYNSETEAETTKSEWVSMNGYAGNSKYGMALRAAKLFQDKTHKVIDLDDWFAWEHEAIAQLVRKAQDQDSGWGLSSPTVISDGTDSSDLDYTTFAEPATSRVMKQVEVNYTGDDYTTAQYADILDESCTQSQPYWSYSDDDIIVSPGQAANIRVRFYPIVTELSENSDTPARPVADYDYVVVNYMLMRAFEYDRNLDMMAYFKSRWGEGQAEMLDEIDKRQRDRPKIVMHPNPLLAHTRDSNSYI